MTESLARLLPRRIAAQTAAVVILSLVLIHVALTAFVLLRDEGEARRNADFVHIATLVRIVAATPAGDRRERLVATMAATFPGMEASLSGAPPSEGEIGPGGGGPRPPPHFAELGPGIRVVDLDPAGGRIASQSVAFGASRPRRFAIGLPDGDWIRLVDRPPPPPPFFFGPWGMSLAIIVVSTILLGLWAARGLVGPLRALAAAARDFDIEGEIEPLPARGPEEVRVAASAFEAMRRRIRALVEDRTHMLAAMGHDLRTPLTRLRLRSEFVADAALREEIQRDLSGMNAMIDGALTYLAEGRHRETCGLVDVAVMVQTISDGHADLGRDITFHGPDHLVARIRPSAFERAVINLVDNALKFGTRCEVRLTVAGRDLVIEVEDDGPGIAETERAAMLRPFVRGDAARNMDEARGFGLGLAIVAAVVDGHAGELTFDAVAPHGLVARIRLPGCVQPAEG
ncbi:MAG: ATP-binding protein [Siculibacillus sp.]|nr:ATP-binding protein [Siculibacillus sp.]